MTAAANTVNWVSLFFGEVVRTPARLSEAGPRASVSEAVPWRPGAHSP